MNTLRQMLVNFLHDDSAVKHTVSLGIFGVFATSYLKVCWATKDFADLDWGWVVVLCALVGVQAAPGVVSRLKQSEGAADSRQPQQP